MVSGFALEQNYPNPFNPTTTINYSLGKPGNVKLTILNILGQKVVELLNGFQNEGSHNVVLNGANFSSGVYLYRLESGGNSLTRKMLLMK